MQPTLESPIAAGAVPAVPAPRPPVHFERRVVEHANRSELNTNAPEQGDELVPPVLQLVRRSAETFSELIEQLRDVESAAAMSGFSAASLGAPGRMVDTYG